jgi:hypothetical protein
MPNRRVFLGAVGGGLAVASLGHAQIPKPPKKRLAIVTTEWRNHSHAWHMGERFLVGYPVRGHWHHPDIEVVAAYVDQKPQNDLSESRSKEFGFPLYPSIAAALRCGGKEIAVDAVLVIGEHGDYPDNEFGQRKYPRYEFFQDVVQVFREDDRAVPVFNDKHLSWKWDWAKEMVDTSKELNFPFLAGSSLPVTWRMPTIDMPYSSTINEAMCLAMGRVDSYDFHALEVIQCMVERRRGGETGIEWVHALKGDEFWKAMDQEEWDKGGWSRKLLHSCLCRSQTLGQPGTFSHRMPSDREIRDMVKDPIAYRIQYRDGLKATMLLMNGLVQDFTFAADVDGQADPLSTLFYLPPVPNVTYSAALMAKAEEMFITGKAPYPVERTLLTGGIVEAGCQSLTKGKITQTPHIDVKYKVSPPSLFLRD